MGTASQPQEREILVDGVRVFARVREGDGVPTVFVHGHPTHSGDWLPFMERIEGPFLAPDLPGWGRSEAPPRDRLDTSMDGLGRFFPRILDAAGVGDYKLVVHDWGVVGLIGAQLEPDRVKRLVVMNVVPLVPGYRWHWVARYFWRRRVLGELINLTGTKAALRIVSREASATPGPLPDEFIDSTWELTPHGTWPHSLRLYRSAPSEALAAAGARLGEITCPALVLWGAGDPYLPVEFGRAMAERLPGAQLREADGAGHWPWIDRPELVGEVVEFLSG